MMQRSWRTLLTSTSDPPLDDSIAENRRVRLERLLQIAAHNFDLRFEFGNRDLVGESQIVMKASPHEVASAHLYNLKGRGLNLLAHYLSVGWTWYEAALRQEAKGSEWFASLWHALEDARVDNWFISRWPGTEKYFDSRLPPFLGGVIMRRLPVSDQLVYGLYLEGRGHSGVRYIYAVERALQEAAHIIQKGAHGDGAQDSYAALLSIYPLLAKLLRSQRLRKSHREFDSDRENDELSTGEDHNRDAQRKNMPPEFDESDELYSVSGIGQRHEFPEWFRPGSAPWFERDLGKKIIHPSALRTSRQTIVNPPQGDPEVYRNVRTEIQKEAGYLANRLTNLLREEVYLRYAGYYRTGRLNKAKLWKQRIGNYRLFQRLVPSANQAVAFTLLVDESASMRGHEKYKLAMKAALLLGETLDFIQVPLEIIGYTTEDYEARSAMKLGLNPAHEYRTTRCSSLEHRIYKRFDEPYFVVRTRLTGIEPRHNNWDEEHLMFAFQRLQERPEQRKVILVISDGQPNGDANYLIETVNHIENTGCKIIGVGIGAEFVKEVYSHAIVVDNFRQMADELFQVLGSEFRAGTV